MKKRALTSTIFVLVLALAFVLKILVPYGEYIFDALILGVTCFAAFETCKLLKNMDKPCYRYFATVFPLLIFVNHLLSFLFDTKDGILWTIAIDLCLVVFCFAILFIFGLATTKKLAQEIRIKKIENKSPSAYAFDKALNTGFVFVYPSFLLMCLTILNHLGDLTLTFAQDKNNLTVFSIAAMILLFVVAIFTDTFAYVVGGLFGGKKLCPKVSPNKTISGAIGGFVFGIAFSFCAYLVLNAIPSVNIAFAQLNFKFWHVLIFACIGSIVCQCGDLFESFLKRRANVKDSGKILPGHGGMLDRMDSYIFLAPVFLACFTIFLACL